MKLLISAAAFLMLGSASLSPCLANGVAAGCCKVCTKGKACGNSCIAQDKNCHQAPGCACNG